MKNKNLTFLFLLIIVFTQFANAQVNIPSVGELRKQGVSEDQIKLLQNYQNSSTSATGNKDAKEIKTSEISNATEVINPTLQANQTILENVSKAEVVRSKAGEEAPTIVAYTRAKVFGQDLMRDGKLNFYQDPKDIRAKDTYIIGEGDELTVNIWGKSEFSGSYVIKSGAIQPNLVGRIYLKGMNYEQAKKLVKSRFSQVYYVSDNSIDVTLNYSRLITVNIVGEVIKPGSYSLPAINTAMNAIAAANGHTDLGSVRNIQIKRDGKTVKTLDLYEYMFNPKYDSNFYLENNDYIFIPTLGKVVDITGKVARQGNYELKEGENLKKLLEYAGGKTSSSFSNIEIIRYINNRNSIINFDATRLERGEDFTLLNGDKININENGETIEEFISVNGAVLKQGSYQFKQNSDKIYDAIERAGGLSKNAEMKNGFIFRSKDNLEKEVIKFDVEKAMQRNSSDNLMLKNLDEILILSKTSYNEKFEFIVKGSVKNPNTFNYAEGMTLKDALQLSGGFLSSADIARIEVSRISNFSGNAQGKTLVENIILSSNKNVLEDDKTASFKLQPFDLIMVRNTPEYSLQKMVRIDGEVNYPGEYAILNNSEKISSLINRAGGYTPHAFLESATLSRKDGKDAGNVLLDLNEIKQNASSLYNYTLKEGDVITIPSVQELIKLQGAIGVNDQKIQTSLAPSYLTASDSVINEMEANLMKELQGDKINVPFVANKRADYYINEFGLGFAQKADKKRTYVIKANGQYLKTRRMFFKTTYPIVDKGSTVVAVYRKQKDRKDKKDKSNRADEFWEKTVTRVTAALTLILLIRAAAK